MTMLVSLLFILGGIALLYYGGEWLVKGSSRLAIHLKIAPLIIGLTVVSFGTSAPELLSSLIAQLSEGSGSVAVGNVVGSNIYNIGLVLGSAALLYPIAVHSSLFRRELPICVLASVALFLMMSDGQVGRIDGGVLLLCFGAYLAFQFIQARQSKAAASALALEVEEYTERIQIGSSGKLWRYLLFIMGGSLALVLGAHFLVKHGILLGRGLGISDRVIGLTAVAFGTSLPELATSVVAAMRKESDIAIGNVVGSNIFNILLVVGSVAAIKPLSYDPILLSRDVPVMLGFTALVFGLLLTGQRLVRWEGAALLVAVLSYTTWLFF